MARGRPRKPIPELVLEGRFRSDRHGEAAGVWIPDGAPEKPPELSGDAAELWAAIVPHLARSAVATAIDAAELTAMCEWWQRYRRASRALSAIEDEQSTEFYRLSILSGMAWKNFAAGASKFGLNPSDRAKLRLGEVNKGRDELLEFTQSN
jgi:P27 family predicted phage terminase small subunit